MEFRTLGRPFDRHIDSRELNALVSSCTESEAGPHGLGAQALWEAESHVASCCDCSRKVAKYRQLLNRSSKVVGSRAALPGDGCPKDNEVDWPAVAAGLWPELRAAQLIMHAALCDHCGPLLRAATNVSDDPTPAEEKLLAELKAPSRPSAKPQPEPAQPGPARPFVWHFLQWKMSAAALALMAIGGVLALKLASTSTPLTGSKFAEFAASTHRQHALGSLTLDVRSNSQQTLNEWLKVKSPFSLALPVSPEVPGNQQPYRLEGARLVQVGGKKAAYIAYQMRAGPASLVVTPESVAVASGGVEVDFEKVSFHYRMVSGYKVVTWSAKGLTYALVSEEGTKTQQSCMVCHSAMRDRDVSQIPTPLHDKGNAADHVFQ